ncbi:MAG: PQQ-dependent sugar dehydrogenase [Verrucomicrobiota bacterium]|nr:PQQ-dependent sugar dehydrogenase [Verrucomicrobiota bacterium]
MTFHHTKAFSHTSLLSLIACIPIALGQTPPPKPVTAYEPSPQAMEAAASLTVAKGFELSIYASEPLLANPVSIHFDALGRCYVVETHRRRTSVYDIRNFPEWLNSDFSFETVKDRAQFFKKNLSAGNAAIPKKFIVDRNQDGIFDWKDLEVESERIVRIEDTNGDGRADLSKVYADGFNSLVSGVAAGVYARGNKVWFTCIPDLWMLTDTDEDGNADQRKALHHGFGVHIAFGGHDMHGLIMGPDGRLYFSIADRGTHVEKDGKTLVSLPHTGAVFRCKPDGSDLEVFATGLRNPQELAFDAEGNLWTVDNNGDGGDKARLAYLVEGGDSGWHIGWQWLPGMGAWNAENLWKTREENSGEYLIPPVAHIGHGPAGFAYYPGSGMPDRFKDHFFLADFPGGIRFFKVDPAGAGFRLSRGSTQLENNDRHTLEGKLLWGLSPVDVTFGPRPGVYVADWIKGWEKTGKGRIFRVQAEDYNVSAFKEVQAMLQEGLKETSIRELGGLLSHQDMRVRLEAQFELVARHEQPSSSVVKVLSGAFSVSALDELTRVAQKGKNLLGRYHAIWGLGQLISKKRDTAKELIRLLEDPAPRIVAQAARVLSDHGVVGYYTDYLRLMQDSDPRTRFFGIKWLWKTLQGGFQEVQHSEQTKTLVNLRQCEPVFEILSGNQGQDAFIQHACVMALTHINDLQGLVEAAGHSDASVRMGAALALRKLRRPEIAVFLKDAETSILIEAARAINDVPILGAEQQLAQLTQRPELPEPALKRAINAQYRLGKTENAAFLISLALETRARETLRERAILALAEWAHPPKRDAITGLWRPLNTRDPRSAAVPLRLSLRKLLTEAPTSVQRACIEAMVALALGDEDMLLLELLKHEQSPEVLKVDIIKALVKLDSPHLAPALIYARASKSEAIYAEAVRYQSRLDPANALTLFAMDLDRESIPVRQAAIAGLAKMATPEAVKLLTTLVDQLVKGTLPESLVLDVLEAGEKINSDDLSSQIKSYRGSAPSDDLLAAYRPALKGGNPELGKDLFEKRQELGCLRCHAISGTGGNVGPILRDPQKELSGEQLLESIIQPNRQITEGYDAVILHLNDGESMSGILRSEQETGYVIQTADGGIHEIAMDRVERRQSAISLMPEGLGASMSMRELRDLIAYLSQP